MKKFKCMLDTYKSNCKPKEGTRGSVPAIKDRIKKGVLHPIEFTSKKLVDELIKGYAVIPAVLENGASDNNFVSQQVFMIDIDNKDRILQVEDALKLCQDLKPAFIYSTFSSTKEIPKYRIVFILDEVITNKNDRDAIQSHLIGIFKEFADRSCKDASRVFYGGKELLYSDFHAVVSVKDTLTTYSESKTKNHSKISDIKIDEYIAENYPKSKLIKSGNTIIVNPCPLCGHQNDFKIFTDTNTFCAFGEEDMLPSGIRKGGTLIDFVKYKENVKKGIAESIICEKYNFEHYTVDDKFQHNKFARMLINKYNIIQYDNLLYYYNGSYYEVNTPKNAVIEKLMIDEFDAIRNSQKNEVYSYIKQQAPIIDPASSKYILFNNGILNIETMELLPFSAEYFIKHKIPHNFVKFDCDNAFVDKMMLEFANKDKEMIPILYELIGYCLYNENPKHRFFFIFGGGQSGKTSFVNLIIEIVGEENCSNSMFQELLERFGTTVLVGKLVNIGDDCKKGRIDDLSIIKQITGNSAFEVEFKGQQRFTYRSGIKMLFVFNTLPIITERGNQVIRRLALIPFDNVFENSKENSEKVALLSDEKNIQYIIYKSIMALKGVIENGFTTSKKTEKALKKYFASVNTCVEFTENNSQYFNDPNILCEDTHNAYELWCEENNFEKEDPITFGRRISHLLGNKEKPKQKSDKTRYYILK